MHIYSVIIALDCIHIAFHCALRDFQVNSAGRAVQALWAMTVDRGALSQAGWTVEVTRNKTQQTQKRPRQ